MVLVWISLIVVPITFLFLSGPILHLFKAVVGEADAAFLYLLAIGAATLIGGAFNVLSSWATRISDFGALGRAKVARQLTTISAQGALGLLSLGPWGLVLGVIFGYSLAVFSLRRLPSWKAVRLSPRLVVAVAKEYRRFPLYTGWASVVTVSGTTAIPMLLAAAFSSEITGAYGMAMRVLIMPSQLISQAIGQVLYPTAIRLKREGASLADFVASTTALLARVSLPLFLFVGFFGQELFSLVLGPEWHLAGKYSEALAWWLMCSFVSAPLSQLVLVIGRNRDSLVISVVEMALRIGSVYAGIAVGSAYMAVVFVSSAGALITLAYSAWVFRAVGVPQIIVWRAMRGLLVPAVFLATTFWALSAMGNGFWPMLIGAVLAIGVVAWSVGRSSLAKSYRW